MTSPDSRDGASNLLRATFSGPAYDHMGRWAVGASATEVAEALGLEPHREGGFFRETYRSPLTLSTEHGERCLATAILYLLTEGSPSRFHRLRFDEMWFYHEGARTELVMLVTDAGEEGRLRVELLGPERPQVFVPRGWWLGARVAPGEAGRMPGGAGRMPEEPIGDKAGREAGRYEEPLAQADWTLAGCVVTPGFEYEDFELATAGSLLRDYPEAADLIRALT